jgi:dihydroxyacetone kinase-like protein
MHTGLIGPGLLDAACPGEVFASPSADQVAAAVRAVDAGAGVLLIVKNYTGDVLNFRLAAQLVEADGIRTETVLVADDVAVDGSTATIGRRGVAGTVLVEKVCGAAAEAGADLATVAALGRRVADAARTMGAALSGVTLPAGGDPAIDLDAGQMEVGVGIHGEPGRERRAAEPADAVVAGLLDAVLEDLDDSGSPDDAEYLLFTNGLGGLPPLELYAAHHLAVSHLEQRGRRVGRSLVGPIVTSLGMVGLSVTLLPVDDELRRHLDAPCRSAGWTVV